VGVGSEVVLVVSGGAEDVSDDAGAADCVDGSADEVGVGAGGSGVAVGVGVAEGNAAVTVGVAVAVGVGVGVAVPVGGAVVVPDVVAGGVVGVAVPVGGAVVVPDVVAGGVVGVAVPVGGAVVVGAVVVGVDGDAVDVVPVVWSADGPPEELAAFKAVVDCVGSTAGASGSSSSPPRTVWLLSSATGMAHGWSVAASARLLS
jgi:hypothetical protein